MKWLYAKIYMDSEIKELSSILLTPRKSPELLARLGSLFARRSLPAYLVGGSVRDLLLERDTHDIDIAVQGDPLQIGQELAELLKGTLVPLGQAHGIARVVVNYEGHHWTIDLSTYRGDIHDDLARRDFTIDAMALPLEGYQEVDSGLVDPFDGRGDLVLGLIRAVGPSVFDEDPARLLRAVRLAAQVGFSIESDTRSLVQRSARLAPAIAQERVREELLKILAEPNTTSHLRTLDELDLLCAIMPELSAAKGVEQPKEHHWDVFSHCVETAGAVEKVVEAPGSREEDPVLGAVPWHPSLEGYFQQEASDGHTRLAILKLAGLLHDIAKPETKTIESSGRMRFFGHADRGAEMAEAILKRLKLSGRGIAMVRTMVEEHLRPSQMSQPGELPTGRAIYRYFRDVGDVAVDTLYLNMADYLAARGPNLDVEDWARHCEMIGYTLQMGLERGSPQVIPKLLDGHDIMQTFGLSPGPRVGCLLRLVEEAQAAGEITNKEDALALVRDNIRSGETHA